MRNNLTVCQGMIVMLDRCEESGLVKNFSENGTFHSSDEASIMEVKRRSCIGLFVKAVVWELSVCGQTRDNHILCKVELWKSDFP